MPAAPAMPVGPGFSVFVICCHQLTVTITQVALPCPAWLKTVERQSRAGCGNGTSGHSCRALNRRSAALSHSGAGQQDRRSR
jgi:hypothetical protein